MAKDVIFFEKRRGNTLTDTQDQIWDMKIVWDMAESGILLTDEPLREAGLKGADVGNELRELIGNHIRTK